MKKWARTSPAILGDWPASGGVSSRLRGQGGSGVGARSELELAMVGRQATGRVGQGPQKVGKAKQLTIADS